MRVWLWKLLWNDQSWMAPCHRVDRAGANAKCFDGAFRVTPKVRKNGSCDANGCWDWNLAKDLVAFANRRFGVANGDRVIFICTTPYGGRHGVAHAEFTGSRVEPDDGGFFQFGLRRLKVLAPSEWQPLSAITTRTYKQGTCRLEGLDAAIAWELVIGSTVREGPVAKTTKEEFNEGYPNEVTIKQPYRDRKLTQQAKAKYGTTCCVCGFDFESVYGKLGAGYIQVHHLRQVAAGEKRNTVDDVRVVCANCHVMLHHRRNDPVSTKALRRVVKMNTGAPMGGQ